MGGIVLVVKSPFGTRLWGGHALNVAEFFSLKGIPALTPPTQGDRHNGTITFDVEGKKIIIDSDYFTPSKEVIRFWRSLGFIILRSEDP